MFGSSRNNGFLDGPDNDIPLQNLTFSQTSSPTSYNFYNGGKAKRVAKQTSGQFLSLAPLPTGLAGGHNTGTINIYGTHSWSCIYTNPNEKFTAITALDANTLIVGLDNGTFFKYDSQNKTRSNLGNAGAQITSIAATQSGFIATLDVNRLAKIWSTTPISSYITEFANCNCITAHGDCFIYHLDNQPVRIWDCNTKSNTPVELPIPNDEKILCMAPLEPNLVACGSSNGKLYIWDINTNICKHIVKPNVPITGIAAFPDYTALVYLDSDGVITIMDYKVARIIEIIQPDFHETLRPEINATLIPQQICPLPNGQFAVTKGNIYFDVYNLPHLQTRSWCTIL